MFLFLLFQDSDVEEFEEEEKHHKAPLALVTKAEDTGSQDDEEKVSQVRVLGKATHSNPLSLLLVSCLSANKFSVMFL